MPSGEVDYHRRGANHRPRRLDDREPVLELLNEIRSSGGQGALFHRIIDCQGREHRVLTLARAAEGQGPVTAIQGVVMDLTRTVAAEAAREAAAAVAGAYANKATIEQAKGIIMGRLDVQACDAFNILAARSQHTNTKLATVANAGLVAAAGQGTLGRRCNAGGFPSLPEHPHGQMAGRTQRACRGRRPDPGSVSPCAGGSLECDEELTEPCCFGMREPHSERMVVVPSSRSST